MWWHTVTHGRGSEGKTGEWSGYPVPFTLPRNMVYPALLPLMRTPRLPVANWTDTPADLNGLVRLAERRNQVSARVPSHFKRSLLHSSANVCETLLFLSCRTGSGMHDLSSLPSYNQNFYEFLITLKIAVKFQTRNDNLKCARHKYFAMSECNTECLVNTLRTGDADLRF